MTDNPTRAQQKEQSRRWIAEALLQILEEKPYNEITISEVAARADLSRRTFYRHFETLDDVIDYQLETLCNEFLDFCEGYYHRKGDVSSMTELFFRFWTEHRSFLRVLNSSNRAAVPQKDFFEKIYSHRLLELDTENTRRMEYMYQFVMGGLWNILLLWAADKKPPTPAEMAEIVDHVFSIAGDAHLKDGFVR